MSATTNSRLKYKNILLNARSECGTPVSGTGRYAVNLRNNAALVAHAAIGFGVSTILTMVAEKTFSGPRFSEITEAFPARRFPTAAVASLGRTGGRSRAT